MSQFRIKVKAFNGQIIDAKIDMFLDGMVVFNKTMLQSKIISKRVYSEAQSEIHKILINIFPKLALKSVDFMIISRDLEMFKKQLLQPQHEELVLAIQKLVISDISKSIGLDAYFSFEEQIKELTKYEQEFKTQYLKSKTIDNKKLIRVSHLIVEKNYENALQILNEINREELSKFEIEEYDFARFQLFLKIASEDVTQKFEKLISDYNDNHRQIKRLYFEYIRFLENIRDDRKPRKLIQEFENIYPISFLSNSESAWYYYLKGRAEYGRGDFLYSLKNLALSLRNVDKNDERLLASIYNTSVNSFTDNLFFDEAKLLAQKSFKLRKKNNYSELYETVSVQGGIEFKSANYKKALDLFLKSELMLEGKMLTKANPSRVYNYIAKTAIMIEDYELAQTYLGKAEKVGDKLGFTKTIELLINLKKQDHAKMDEVFKSSIMLSENHKIYDNFAIGWGYTYMAISSFEQKKFKNGVHHLMRGVDYFMDDMYLIEAFYISLYIYKYAIPQEEIQRFRDLTKYFDLHNEYIEFIKKHIEISKNYTEKFGIQSSEINLLKQFYDDTKNITDENYNPEIVKEILDSICLM